MPRTPLPHRLPPPTRASVRPTPLVPPDGSPILCPECFDGIVRILTEDGTIDQTCDCCGGSGVTTVAQWEAWTMHKDV